MLWALLLVLAQDPPKPADEKPAAVKNDNKDAAKAPADGQPEKDDKAKQAPPPPTLAETLFNVLPLVLMVFMAYLLFFRAPMKRQEAERNALMSALKKNDRVLTTSGIYGTVVAISEKDDEITVKVDDNVRLRMTKASILRRLEEPGAAKEGGA